MKQKLRIGSALLVALLTLGMGTVASGQSPAEAISEDNTPEGNTAENNTKLVIDQKQFQRSITENGVELVAYQSGNKVFPGVYEDDDSFTEYESIVIDNTTYNFWKDVENSVDDIVVVENVSIESDTTAYIRTIFAFPAFSDENEELHLNFYKPEGVTDIDEVLKKVDGLAEINGQSYKLYVYNYNEPVAPGETSKPSLLEYAFDKSVTTEMIDELGDEYKVLITSQAVQKTGFSALADAFGATFQSVTAENHPWENMN